MTYDFDGYNYIMRLRKGEKLIENLRTFAKEKQLKGASLSGLGGATQATLGYYNLQAQEYEWKDFTEVHEVTSLQGNLAWDGDEPVWHVHATLSDKDFAAFGGHVKELHAGATLEVFLHMRFGDATMTRRYDGEIGLKLLDL